MADHFFPEPENPSFPHVRMLNAEDPVRGATDGDGGGADNIAPRQLTERTAYLKKQIDGFVNELFSRGSISTPLLDSDGLAICTNQNVEIMARKVI